MSWKYSQGSGRVTDKNGNLLVVGYAGAEPNGKNNPLAQSIADVGPLPQGKYTIDPPLNLSDTGPYSLPLIPDPENEMYGRSNFLIHGDSVNSPGIASKGCVVLPLFARQRIFESGDHELQVVA